MSSVPPVAAAVFGIAARLLLAFEGRTSIDGHNGRIRGDKISFTVDGQSYRGAVRSSTIEGEGGAARWRATRTAN
jgi:hypothetical protein